MIYVEITKEYDGWIIKGCGEGSIEQEARRKAEEQIEKKIEKIKEIQEKCDHEWEFFDYNDWFQSYRFKCKKCGKIRYEGKNIFSDDFFEAWRKGLITIPANLFGGIR